MDSEEGLVHLGAQIVWQAVEAENKDIKPVLGDLFFRWLNNNPAVKPLTTQASPPTVDMGGGKAAGKHGAGLAITEASSELDSIAGTLNKTECACLALSLETGHVHILEDVADMPYGTNPQLSAVAKARRKAGLDSLSKFIEKKDGQGVVRHFTDLIRDLSESGHTAQAALVTSFLMETQQLFRDDSSTMITYLQLYLRKYMGKGVPVKFDFSLYAQAVSILCASVTILFFYNNDTTSSSASDAVGGTT